MNFSSRVVTLACVAGLFGACGGSVDEDNAGGSGGNAGNAGSAGSMGALLVSYGQKVDKIDLLFMIDNSASMADKQQILASAVPDLVNRLVAPRCISADGAEVVPGSDGKCPIGARREFDPVYDIHIGVISSSLGGHGSDVCSPGPSGGYNARQEDMAHLIQRKCADAQCTSYVPAETWQNKGFLFWDPKQHAYPPGEKDLPTLTSRFADLVTGTGQDGCGFEASLEAWYRFLVDPAPFARIVPTDCSTGLPMDGGPCRGPDGQVDETVLSQRKDFLRPDSLVGIIMLTDENDCSVVEGGQGFLSTQAFSGMSPFHLPRATSVCLSDPNSPQCVSCGVSGTENDPECQKGAFSDQEDALNLRCYRQKQRFGIDFLYPVRRYAYGLTQPVFKPQLTSNPADVDAVAYPAGVTNGEYNPLFCTEYEKDAQGLENRKLCKTIVRDPSLVFFAGIVGVPWQDIARDPNDLSKGYRSAEELGWTLQQFEMFNQGKPVSEKRTPPPGVTDQVTVWDQIVGKSGYLDSQNPVDAPTRTVGGVESVNPHYLQPDPNPSGFPLDPLMIESIDPREGVNPATGTQLAPAQAPSPTSNPINGHEWNIPERNDLQYACTFELPTPKQCFSPESCDCSAADKDGTNNPLCQSDSGNYGKIQYRAKAYPGRRQLAALRAVEKLNPGRAIPASICPSNTTDTASKDYGYRPAISAIMDRLRSVLAGSCLATKLSPAEDGSVGCRLLEATKMPEGMTSCAPCDPTMGRAEVSSTVLDMLNTYSEFKDNNLQCVCEILQASPGPQLDACISSSDDFPMVNGAPVNGWCYVDPSADPAANQGLVAGCPAEAKRMIRFAGNSTPVTGSLPILHCAL